MGDRANLVVSWILWIQATFWSLTGHTDRVIWPLGSAILFRMLWQESRD